MIPISKKCMLLFYFFAHPLQSFHLYWMNPICFNPNDSIIDVSAIQYG